MQNQLTVRRAMATEAKVSGPVDDGRPDFSEKCTNLRGSCIALITQNFDPA